MPALFCMALVLAVGGLAVLYPSHIQMKAVMRYQHRAMLLNKNYRRC